MDRSKSNYIYSCIYQLLVIALPLVTAPYVARVLGADRLGVYTYTYAIANYFVMFIILGMASHGNRAIATAKSTNESREVFYELYSLQITWGIFVCGIYVLFIILYGNAENKFFYFAQGLYVLSSLFDVSWYFFGREEFKITVTRNIIIKLLGTVAVLIFVKDISDIIMYAVLVAGFTLLGNLILWAIAMREVGFRYRRFQVYRSHIKQNLVLFIPIIAISVYTLLSKILLGNFASNEDVTFYEYAHKIVSAPLGLITALGTVMMPRMTNLYANNKQETASRILLSTFDFVGIISLPMCVGMAIVAEDFAVLFYGEPFKVCGQVMSILAFTIPFIAYGNVLRNQILIPLKKDAVFVISVVIGAIVSLGFNLLLIPKYAAIGSAVATVLTEIVVCMYQAIGARHYYKSKILIKQLSSTFISATIMGICVFILRRMLELSWVSLIFSIITGMIIYGIMIIVFKDSIRKSILSVLARLLSY